MSDELDRIERIVRDLRALIDEKKKGSLGGYIGRERQIEIDVVEDCLEIVEKHRS